MAALSPPPPKHLSSFYHIIHFRTCSSMGVEGGVGISSASEGCQDTLPTWAAGASRGVRTWIPATGIFVSVAKNFMLWALNQTSPELQISAILVLKHLPGELSGNKYKNTLSLWYTQALLTLTFAGAPFWLQKTALLVGNTLTSCGLVFSSKSANTTEERELMDTNRQMNQTSFFLFILLPQRKDKNRTRHYWVNMEVYVDIGEISVYHSLSPRIRQSVSM